ncbi:MAG: SRPBCC family protein [Nitrospiraceae bacterium]
MHIEWHGGIGRKSARGRALAALGTALVGGVGGYTWQGAGRESELGGDLHELSPDCVEVNAGVLVLCSAHELYRFWRNFENLPSFIDHLLLVSAVTKYRSHWVVKAPLGKIISWDAEVIHDQVNRHIGWQSLGGSMISHAASVRFIPLGPSVTKVQVSWEYQALGGAIGTTIAHVLGNDPQSTMHEDLARLKRLMEIGDTPAAA